MNSLTPPCDDDHHEQPESQVLSLRIEAALFERLNGHAAKRGMSVQDYVVRTLVRDDFDERFKASVERTERFYGHSARSAGGLA
ncbi:hypothetical protein ACH4RA_31535 [Streptomyces smyrnaeus]|uniref:hypothetical protein n=1 Tax=Streptomyces TaxID=1883 RepID=UPI000C191029|nr:MULTISPECIES: hypothetical protein [unclassified Streptomyces]MBQ0867805.1 hypothetical protein [Streptomyces sp. RK75]MBQ1119121.1 hypothetical protein [Streptomyces sp. B15]MBQ1161950.1 hypothetical protein [Streptomyces sp. A73]